MIFNFAASYNLSSGFLLSGSDVVDVVVVVVAASPTSRGPVCLLWGA